VEDWLKLFIHIKTGFLKKINKEYPYSNNMLKPEYVIKTAAIGTILISALGCAGNFSRFDLMMAKEFEDNTIKFDCKLDDLIESKNINEIHEDLTKKLFKIGGTGIFDALVKKYPDDYRNHIIRGDAFLKDSYLQKRIGILMVSTSDASLKISIESYNKALELNKTDIYTYGMLGFIYGENKEYGESEKMFKKALDIAPDHPLLYLALGQMHERIAIDNENDRIGNYKSAIDHYKKILKLDEEDINKHLELMNQYFHRFIDRYPNTLEEITQTAKENIDKILNIKVYQQDFTKVN
jgi:tetratricopeptide (TPR) repeat protein|tara:strand:- start:6090 stop:6974 length:885 start_codon:yes stop_codon:yes gene_type:complete